MFLRATKRQKDGKEHTYWSVVESVRTRRGVIQKQLLYLGELNKIQREAWDKSLTIFETPKKIEQSEFECFCSITKKESAFKHESELEKIQIKIEEIKLKNPRQWGACWLVLELWDKLKLDGFWKDRLPKSRKGTEWLKILKTLICYRVIDPGSEWRLSRHWYHNSAMRDLLNEDDGLSQKDKLYKCLDLSLKHKEELFKYLKEIWVDIFGINYEIILYDLTSTYFECEAPESGKRKFGYSRDKRFDCVQVVIGLVITTGGFPLAYKVMNGNTSDKATLKDFIKEIEDKYGKSNRIWLMDRGIPTEEMLEEMRGSNGLIKYLVGTPRGKLTLLEKDFLSKSWEQVKDDVRIKTIEEEGEKFILALSGGRRNKERSMRKRKLKKLISRLKEIKKQDLTRDELLKKIGAAEKDAGNVNRLVEINVCKIEEWDKAEKFTFKLKKDKLRKARQREGCYLLRTNLKNDREENLWQMYIQLTEIEQAFKELKNDLAIRPIYHNTDERIEAHIFIAFLAYCIFVTLKKKLSCKASGLTPRAVIEKMAQIQMLDVELPTTDGRCIELSRYTQPETDHNLILHHLGMFLPKQSPPRITSNGLA